MIMMDIKIPACCFNCPFSHVLGEEYTGIEETYCDAPFHKTRDTVDVDFIPIIDPFRGRAEGCPIIEIQPHGELIERKAIEEWLLTECASLDTYEDQKYVVERLKKEIPTIIPAYVIGTNDGCEAEEERT